MLSIWIKCKLILPPLWKYVPRPTRKHNSSFSPKTQDQRERFTFSSRWALWADSAQLSRPNCRRATDRRNTSPPASSPWRLSSSVRFTRACATSSRRRSRSAKKSSVKQLSNQSICSFFHAWCKCPGKAGKKSLNFIWKWDNLENGCKMKYFDIERHWNRKRKLVKNKE